MQINRLLGESHINKNTLEKLLSVCDKAFTGKTKDDFLNQQLDYGLYLTRRDGFKIAKALVDGTSFILKTDKYNRKIVRDEDLLPFLNKNIDIFILTALIRLNEGTLTPMEQDIFLSCDSLVADIDLKWAVYSMNNPDSNLQSLFSKDPQVEHLLNQKKLDLLGFFYRETD